MLDYYIRKEQENRVQEAIVALKEEANKQTELNASGEWDGFMGDLPQKELWTLKAYRHGYLAGITRRFDQKYGVEIEPAF